MHRYAIMSLGPISLKSDCIAAEAFPPASTTSWYWRAAVSSHSHVSLNALICADALVPVFSAKRTL